MTAERKITMYVQASEDESVVQLVCECPDEKTAATITGGYAFLADSLAELTTMLTMDLGQTLAAEHYSRCKACQSWNALPVDAQN